MSEITDLSETDADNTTISGANVAENCAFSGLNNAIRNLAGMVKRGYDRLTGHYASTGSANAYVLTPDAALSAYVTGERYSFRANFANTGAATLNISGLGAKTIKKMTTSGKADLASGDIQNGQPVTVEYDGTDLIMVTPPTVVDGTVLNINGLTAETTISGSSDTVAIYDASASANRKAAVNDINRGWVFLDTKTASSSSALTFTNLDSTYAAYMFVLDNVHPSNDGSAILIQLSSDGGSSFLTSSVYQYHHGIKNPGADAETVVRTTSGSVFQVTNAGGNGSSEGASGQVIIYGMGSSGLPRIRSETIWVDATSGAFEFGEMSGVYGSAVTANALKFFCLVGSLSGGTIRLYGLKKS